MFLTHSIINFIQYCYIENFVNCVSKKDNHKVMSVKTDYKNFRNMDLTVKPRLNQVLIENEKVLSEYAKRHGLDWDEITTQP